MIVSIIIPSKNEGERIAYALDYWLNQTYKDFEIVVVDDSDDNTPEIIKQYTKKNDNIKLVKGDKKGVGAARNLGFKYANGDVIIGSDADGLPDFRQDDYLKSVVEAFKEDNSIDIVFSDYKILFTDNLLGNILSIYDTGIRYKAMNHMAEAYRKSVFKDTYIQDGLTVGEDKDFFQRAMNNSGKIGVTKIPRIMASGVYTWKEFIARYLWYGSKTKDLIRIRKDTGDFINLAVCLYALVGVIILPISVYNIIFLLPFLSLILLEYLREIKIFSVLKKEKQLLAFLLEPFVVYISRVVLAFGFISSFFRGKKHESNDIHT